MSDKICSIVILNYNGLEFLKACLPSVVKAVEYSGQSHEIIVADNNSSDSSVDFIKSKFPLVKIIRFKENKYIFAFNEVAKHVKNRYIISLNNDIMLNENIISLLLEPFKDRNVFSVAAKLLYWDGESLNAAKREIEFKWGFLRLHHQVETKLQSYTLFAPGGASAFDKEKFIELGGFDDLYKPFYGDDLDLSYRAWKRGWKVIYKPDAIMYHKNVGTIKKFFLNEYIAAISTRNIFLFIWKNITDKRLIAGHLIFITPRLLYAFLMRNKIFIFGFIKALPHLKEALSRRRKSSRFEALNDRELMKFIKESK